MRTRLTLALVLCLMVLCLSARRAEAALITFSFTGTVGAVDAPLAGTFSAGQALNGSYTFDSGLADFATEPERGAYAPVTTSFTVGGYSGGGLGGISIFDAAIDTYVFQTGTFTGADVAGLDRSLFRLELSGGDSSVFASDALPLTPQILARSRFAASCFNFEIRRLARLSGPPAICRR